MPAINSHTHQPAFTGSPLDRADHLRDRSDIWLEHRRDPRCRILPVSQKGLIYTVEAGGLGWLEPGDIPGTPDLFLGLKDGAPHWAWAAPDDTNHPSMKWRELRSATIKGQIDQAESAIAAQAKSMLDWHARHGFCSNCGAETSVFKLGYQRSCPRCEAQHFPRTDPVVIMLAIRGDFALVGRGHALPAPMMSALAGFMEPGESIEEAAVRELWEEAGIRAHSVAYVASQPWPWPSSLMIGCVAKTDDTTLTIDTKEIAEARWITKAEARAALAGQADFTLPPPLAMAHHLIKYWLATGT